MQAEQGGCVLPVEQFTNGCLDHHGDSIDIFRQPVYCFDPDQLYRHQQLQQWQVPGPKLQQPQQLHQPQRQQHCVYYQATGEPTTVDNDNGIKKKAYESASSRPMLSEWSQRRAQTLHNSMTSYAPLHCFDQESDWPSDYKTFTDHRLNNRRRSGSLHRCARVRDQGVLQECCPMEDCPSQFDDVVRSTELDPKPFGCAQCGRRFATSGYLAQHDRIHWPVKPYCCPICPAGSSPDADNTERRFAQLCHLQQHMRTHTGERPYLCTHPSCGRTFSQLSNLQSHSKTHKPPIGQPYRCRTCCRCFADEQSLAEHRATKHRRRSSVESSSDGKLQRAKPTCDELMLQPIPVSTLSSSVPAGCCGSTDTAAGEDSTRSSDYSDIVDDIADIAWLQRYVQQQDEYDLQHCWTKSAARCQQLYHGEDELQMM